MIGPTLFIASSILYLLANYWREKTVPPEGAARPNRTTALLMFDSVCATIGAVLVVFVYMVTFVS